MSEEEKEIFKKHLVAMLQVFKDKPNLLANYMIEYGPLKKRFVNKIINSDALNRISQSIKEEEYVKPFFINLEEMQKYYNSLFEVEGETVKRQVNPILGSSTTKEALFKQLNKALEVEDYSKAAKLRDYIISIGINMDDFLN